MRVDRRKSVKTALLLNADSECFCETSHVVAAIAGTRESIKGRQAIQVRSTKTVAGRHVGMRQSEERGTGKIKSSSRDARPLLIKASVRVKRCSREVFSRRSRVSKRASRRCSIAVKRASKVCTNSVLEGDT